MTPGKLVIYCCSHRYSFVDKFAILLDDKKVGSLQTGVTFNRKLAPKEYQVSLKKAWKKYKPLEIEIKSNEECKLTVIYYFPSNKKKYFIRSLLLLLALASSIVSGPLCGAIVGVAFFYGRYGEAKLVREG